jgi:hypothetical protein
MPGSLPSWRHRLHEIVFESKTDFDEKSSGVRRRKCSESWMPLLVRRPPNGLHEHRRRQGGGVVGGGAATQSPSVQTGVSPPQSTVRQLPSTHSRRLSMSAHAFWPL